MLYQIEMMRIFCHCYLYPQVRVYWGILFLCAMGVCNKLVKILYCCITLKVIHFCSIIAIFIILTFNIHLNENIIHVFIQLMHE